MNIYPKTRDTIKPKEIEANPYKVFVAKNTHFIEVDKTPTENNPEARDYWEYDLYEYDASEYVQFCIQRENKIQADMEYIAMMSDIDLDEGEEEEENVEEV